MFSNKQNAQYDVVIAQTLEEMQTVNSDSDEFKTMLKRVDKLTKLKTQNGSKPLSKDTLAIVVGNLAGIAMIVGYERAHVVTSKALGFVLKSK